MLTFSRLRPAVLIMLVVCTAALAQTITGSISGTVTDSTGGMIPGAIVTLTSEKTGQARGSATNSEGRFNFAALQPGSYALKVERQGFQTLEQTRRDPERQRKSGARRPQTSARPGE